MVMESLVLSLLVALAAGFIGALLGGKAASAGHYRYAQKRDLETKSNQLLNLFQALNAELAAVWERVAATVGNDLEKAKHMDEFPYAMIFAATHNYFSVYDHSAQLLGTLDPESGKRIIETYTNLKAFLDELNNYNQLAQKHRDVRLGANLNLYEVNQVREQLEEYFRLLKKRHAQVKGQVLLCLEMLKEFLNLAEQSRTSVKIKI
jgi:regulator of sigma D